MKQIVHSTTPPVRSSCIAEPDCPFDYPDRAMEIIERAWCPLGPSESRIRNGSIFFHSRLLCTGLAGSIAHTDHMDSNNAIYLANTHC